MAKNETVFSKDLQNKKLVVTRKFNGSLDDVWEAWTTSEKLDQWWAPKPYRAETKSMNFSEGGAWLYCMVGPEGDRQWCIVDYLKIDPKKSITSTDAFCDEAGTKTPDFPVMKWHKQFNGNENETTVTIELTFDSEADMNKILEMGFEEGFKMGLDNLEELLAS